VEGFDNYRLKVQGMVTYNEKKYELLFLREKGFLKKVVYKHIKDMSKEDPNTKAWEMINAANKREPWNFEDAFPVYENVRDFIEKKYIDKMREFQREYKTVLTRNDLVITEELSKK